MEEDSNSLEYSPTWIVAMVSLVIILLSLSAERGLHKLGKLLKNKKQDALFEALQKLKEELMLLGFISLLLTVGQGVIQRICMPPGLASHMLPCKKHAKGNNHEKYSLQASNNGRRLLSVGVGSEYCAHKGKVPLLSLEALHQLHIFIFVLAVVHVIFCVTTMLLGGARIGQWKQWEDSIKGKSHGEAVPTKMSHVKHRRSFIEKHAGGDWRKAAVISWTISFFKQFYGSITKSDYVELRYGFIRAHCPNVPHFDFHKYMMRTLEIDFKKVVGISWYLWLFVVLFLLLNVEGWHSYFWLSFLPLVLLLLVGAKLEHIIMRLAQEAAENTSHDQETAGVEPSDRHFWFHNPTIVLHLIHFILFQNSFEIAFFFWIWSTYGFHSCIMEKLGYIVPRLIMGVIVQVLCSYSTMPLYALVSQMGSHFKRGMFNEQIQNVLDVWAGSIRADTSNRYVTQTENSNHVTEESAAASIIELPVLENPTSKS